MQTTKNEDPEMAKLDLALAAVKEDILSTNKQITDERKWVIAVAKIIASYNDKVSLPPLVPRRPAPPCPALH